MLRLMLGGVFAVGLAAAPKHVVLQQEERTTLRVGELAVLQIPTDRRYVVEVGKITPEGRLRTVRRSRSGVLFRAVRPGNDVFVLSPVTKPGECISCTTLHFYIDVIP